MLINIQCVDEEKSYFHAMWIKQFKTPQLSYLILHVSFRESTISSFFPLKITAERFWAFTVKGRAGSEPF